MVAYIAWALHVLAPPCPCCNVPTTVACPYCDCGYSAHCFSFVRFERSERMTIRPCLISTARRRLKVASSSQIAPSFERHKATHGPGKIHTHTLAPTHPQTHKQTNTKQKGEIQSRTACHHSAGRVYGLVCAQPEGVPEADRILRRWWLLYTQIMSWAGPKQCFQTPTTYLETRPAGQKPTATALRVNARVTQMCSMRFLKAHA